MHFYKCEDLVNNIKYLLKHSQAYVIVTLLPTTHVIPHGN